MQKKVWLGFVKFKINIHVTVGIPTGSVRNNSEMENKSYG